MLQVLDTLHPTQNTVNVTIRTNVLFMTYAVIGPLFESLLNSMKEICDIAAMACDYECNTRFYMHLVLTVHLMNTLIYI